MKTLALFLLLSVVLTAEGQSEKVSKHTLYKAFEETIDQESNNKISTLSNPWKTDNVDSAYFKCDTIKLINFQKRDFTTEFRTSINWSFFKKNKFFRAYVKDSLARVQANAPEFKISITQIKRELFITTWEISRGVPVLAEEFKVIKLMTNSSASTLTLLRIKKSLSD
jgi:hypothetical protein